ncbi:MAG: hypothetical protein DRH04_00695 [Deltaproteobacteria bacterium]|nr:MAG: hypothetical protein DRH04_00695 [Deltaproteobacteria bacterium]
MSYFNGLSDFYPRWARQPPKRHTDIRKAVNMQLVPFVAEDLIKKGMSADDVSLIMQRLQPRIKDEIGRVLTEITEQRATVLRYIIQLLGLDRCLSEREQKLIFTINRECKSNLTRNHIQQLISRVEKGETIVEEKDIVVDDDLRRYICKALYVESQELDIEHPEVLVAGKPSRQERLEELRDFLHKYRQAALYYRWKEDWRTAAASIERKRSLAPGKPGSDIGQEMFSRARCYYDSDSERNQELLNFDINLMDRVMEEIDHEEGGLVVNLNEKLSTKTEMYIIGDLHGCLCNLEAALSIGHIDFFNRVERNPHLKLFFLGDYVDRGICPTEVLRLVCLLKKKYPKNIFLLRGNHETHSIHRLDGRKIVMSGACPADFHEIYVEYLGIEYFEKLVALEQKLPIAYFVEKAGKTIMLCHGGIVRNQHIDRITTRQSLAEPQFVEEILWSDPLESTDETNNQEDTRFPFGKKAAQRFLEKVDADLIIRGHEAIEEGYKAIWETKVLTIFSAGGMGNYCNGGSYEEVTPQYLSIRWNNDKFVIKPHEILFQAYSESYQRECEAPQKDAHSSDIPQV